MITDANIIDTASSNTPHTYYGLSTDTKPTEGVRNGSKLIEMDTGKVYFFDAEGAQWLEFGGSSAALVGGGGGGGDSDPPPST